MYKTSYGGQAVLGGPSDWRPVQQAQFIKSAGLAGRTGLRVVEMGCAAGFTLYNVRDLASHGGQLNCFEADRDLHAPFRRTFANAAHEGIDVVLTPQMFDGSALQPSSVDLFMSSHVVEHWADPCSWMDSVWWILKPGGLVFTEVPVEYNDPDNCVTRGQYHFLYFNEASFAKMMTDVGFEQVQLVTVGPPVTQWGEAVRSIFRKPR